MKKLLLILFSTIIFYSCEQADYTLYSNNIIIKCEYIDENLTRYEVKSLKENHYYTFTYVIDSINKYNVGDKIKLTK